MWIHVPVLGGVIMGGFLQLPWLAMAGVGVAVVVSSSIRWVNGENQGAFQKGDSDIAATQVDVYADMDDSRISQLPDDILDNIVSRLATIEASRTSILARRWRKIWTMNLKIELLCIDTFKNRRYDDVHIDCNDKLRFLKAVDQCLKLYSGQKLKIFWMTCCFLRDCTSHLEQWIQSLDRLGVENIFLGSLSCCYTNLEMITTLSFNLISRISTLITLYLVQCNVDPDLTCQFNSLLKLRLEFVPLLKGELSCLLLSCPNLKFLIMKYCEMPSSLNISGPNLKLMTLKLFSCEGLHELNICASNLVELNINSSSVDLLFSSSLPKLKLMYFETFGKHTRPYPFVAFVGIPSYLPQLKCLSIQTFTNEMPWITCSFNMFSNLKNLCLGMDLLQMFDLGNITPVLNSCPLLEAFYVAVKSSRTHTKEKRGEWPALRHKHLEHMELSGFSKTEHEFEFVRFILRSSQVLRCLVLKSSVRLPGSCTIRSCFADRGGGEEYAPPEVQSICHHLQAHAVSIHAKVKMCR